MGIYKSIDVITATDLFDENKEVFCKKIGALLKHNFICTTYLDYEIIDETKYDFGFEDFAECTYRISSPDADFPYKSAEYELEFIKPIFNTITTLKVYDNGFIYEGMSYELQFWSQFASVFTKTNEADLDFYRYDIVQKTNDAVMFFKQLAIESIFIVPDVVSEYIDESAHEHYVAHNQTITKDFIRAIIKEKLGDVFELSNYIE